MHCTAIYKINVNNIKPTFWEENNWQNQNQNEVNNLLLKYKSILIKMTNMFSVSYARLEKKNSTFMFISYRPYSTISVLDGDCVCHRKQEKSSGKDLQTFLETKISKPWLIIQKNQHTQRYVNSSWNIKTTEHIISVESQYSISKS